MLGQPKYKYGDLVKFCFDDGKKQIAHYGKIEIIDAYGTFGQSKEVSYDIMGIDERVLFKHVVESDVYEINDINGCSIQILKDENSYVHYGAKFFVRDKFKPIENRDFINKPDGGLWASSCKAKNSWCTWCVENNFRKPKLDECFHFSLSKTANILRIESLEDCKELILHPVGYMHEEYMNPNYEVIDYKACMERGIDAIEYRYDIACKSEDFEEIDSIMRGWDCDSILILNPEIIIPGESKI